MGSLQQQCESPTTWQSPYFLARHTGRRDVYLPFACRTTLAQPLHLIGAIHGALELHINHSRVSGIRGLSALNIVRCTVLDT